MRLRRVLTGQSTALQELQYLSFKHQIMFRFWGGTCMLSIRQPCIAPSHRTLFRPHWICISEAAYQARQDLVFQKWCFHHEFVYLSGLVTHSPRHLKIISRWQFQESVLIMLILNIKSDNPKRSLLEGNWNICFFLLSIRIDLLDSFQMAKSTNA